MLNKNSCIDKFLIVIITTGLAISGCTSVVDFGEASSSKLQLPNTAWKDRINHTNTYFAYAVKIELKEGHKSICDRGTGTPFSDFKQTYSLFLAPKEVNVSEEDNVSGQLQPVITFKKDKTSCSTGGLNRILTPFKPIKKAKYSINRINFSDENIDIDFEGFYGLAKKIALLSATGGVGEAMRVTTILENELTRTTYSELSGIISNAINQWTDLTRKNVSTIPIGLIEPTSVGFDFHEIRIPIKIINDNNEVDFGNIIIYPEFRRSIWFTPAEMSKVENITINDVKDRNLSDFEVFGSKPALTYGQYLDVSDDVVSSSYLSSIGKDISWDNSNDIKHQQSRLLNSCEKTKNYMQSQGMHALDLQLFLAQRMELSPLWNGRIKTLPELPNERDVINLSDVDKLNHEKDKLLNKESIDLSRCLNQPIQSELGNSLITSESVKEHVDTWRKIMPFFKERRLLHSFEANVYPSLKRFSDVDYNKLKSLDEIETSKYESEKKEVYLRVLSRNEMIELEGEVLKFEDKTNGIDYEHGLSKLWEIDLYSYGCLLPYEKIDENGINPVPNAIEMLYLSRSNNIGHLVFEFSPNNNGSLKLDKIIHRDIKSINDPYLKRVQEEINQNAYCMSDNGPYKEVIKKLGT